MTQPTYEEAKRCPRCKIPGEHVSSTPAKDSRGKPVSVHTIFCRTDNCPWYNTSWIVQVNPDGSVPPPTLHKRGDIEKAFPARNFGDTEEARVVESLQRQLEQETKPGGGEVGGGRR